MKSSGGHWLATIATGSRRMIPVRLTSMSNSVSSFRILHSSNLISCNWYLSLLGSKNNCNDVVTTGCKAVDHCLMLFFSKFDELVKKWHFCVLWLWSNELLNRKREPLSRKGARPWQEVTLHFTGEWGSALKFTLLWKINWKLSFHREIIY